MKVIVTALLLSFCGLSAEASVRREYVKASISSIETLADSAGGTTNTYRVTYSIQPCAQQFVEVKELRLPDLEVGAPGTQSVTNTSIVVILNDSGLQCMGPTMQQTAIYTASEGVQNPRAL